VNVDDANDQARFAEVFLPHLVDAFRLASWLAGSRADAEDIVQEASMRAFKSIRGFSGGHPRAWVLTIVRNTSYSWLAKNRPAALVLTEDPRLPRAGAARTNRCRRRSTNAGGGTDRQNGGRRGEEGHGLVAGSLSRGARAERNP
jgi:DNA-directed RNA polymerase specialized sigma24 family protein